MMLLFLSWFLTCNGTKWPKLCLCAVKKLLTHCFPGEAGSVYFPSVFLLHMSGISGGDWRFLWTGCLIAQKTVSQQ